MKIVFLFCFLLVTVTSFSQQLYKNKSEIYNFEMPSSYKSIPSNNERNEFIFANAKDTTSLVINVNDRIINDQFLKGFKSASNEEVEKNFYRTISNPKIIKRGEVANYKDQSIYFYVTHATTNNLENNFMMNYLFYHRGKEINFIFRTKERRLEKALPDIEAIINSVKLL